ncbi:MAG: pilus assembly protein [Rhodospirillales bacterium]|jgi:Flp pilus assembly protein TadG|nr:pilus assembly protein [Rhodospirillales bacterium]
MTKITNFASHLLKNRCGVAAIEFALLAPIMLVMLTGVVELSYLMMAERRVSGAAHAAADLIAQETDLTSSDISEIFQASRLIMEPFDDADLTLGAVSVLFDDDTGDATVDWSENYNGGSVDDPTSLTADLADPGKSVIIVSATFSYTPVLGVVLSGTFTLDSTAITRPRYLDNVGLF